MKLLFFAVFLVSAVAAHRNRVFSPIFELDNVPFQNTTAIRLKEGENLFLVPKRLRGNGAKLGVNKAEKPEIQYMKLNYNPAKPDQVCMEYGVIRKAKASDIVVDEYDGDY